MISLQAVADYMKTGRLFKALKILLGKKKPIIKFDTEHANRPPRFIAIINDYKTGMKIDDIALKYGCSKNTIHRYARMAGLYRPKESTVRDSILAMYQLDKPIAEISAKLGVSQALVSKYASEAGINRVKHKK